MKVTMISVTAFLILSSCDVPGDFCQVVKRPLIFAPETARQMVRTNRPEAEQIAVQNSYGAKHCEWRAP